jgi:SAM-dependent methyltransferase
VGGQLFAFLQLGFQNLLGIDPSQVCANLAREKFGLNVRTGALLDLDESDGFFDLIILGSVVEHLRNPRPALQRLAGFLAPGGFLYIEVPDVLRFTEVLDAPFQEFSMEHVNFFSPRSLTNLMARCGLAPVFCNQTLIEQTPSKQVAEIKGLYRRSQATEFIPDRQSQDALRRYITVSREIELCLHQSLDLLAAKSKPLLVWGVGTHTQHLLANSRLADLNIVAYVDANPRYQGLTLRGVPILSPEALANHKEPILISSQQFQDEIVARIKLELRLPNELILLYPLRSTVLER